MSLSACGCYTFRETSAHCVTKWTLASRFYVEVCSRHRAVTTLIILHEGKMFLKWLLRSQATMTVRS